ncbi:methyltransferase [Microbulbifer variabilis]|uniref:methyltransferase n=1 Tax=Microbulbifer variabilis TaxID=266805 RepID=UPI00036F8A96|nr:methyltransferase [Microbulbifer variabilis]
MQIKAPTTSDAPMWDLLMGNYTFACLMVSAQLDITGLIDGGFDTCEKLSNKLQLSRKGIYLFILLLQHLGYINVTRNQLKNTELAKQYLDRNSQYYWGEVLLDPFNIYNVNHLNKKILTSLKHEYELECRGRSVTDMWRHDEMDGDSAAAFTHLMHAQGFASAVSAVQNGAFSNIQTLLDAGAGSGTIALAFCDAYPERNALLFDLAPVCMTAKEYVDKFAKKKQISIVEGDFFKQDWPTGCDGVCFSNVLHDWKPDTSIELLSKAYAALPKGGSVLIHDMLFNITKLTPVLFSFHLFMNHGAQLFSLEELFQLLNQAGFENPQCHKALGYFAVVSAIRP